ncbi:hypothetical protein [Helicobacter pametensis]|uniref:hypothetical protein n=1 Tax=Helicobacter pametensis TaxID=95149 RepID=UPI0004810896|nr:hypothetical protein [Helicobacter pametensis]
MENWKGYFKDIDDALKQLVDRIELTDLGNTVILGLFGEKTLLAKRVAQYYGLPLEYLLTAPIRAPENRDCIIALVSEKMDVVLDAQLAESFDISYDQIYAQATRVAERVILPRVKRLRGENAMMDFKDRDVLIVNEGVELGFEVELAIKMCLKDKCRSLSLATPVVPSDILELLLAQCDCVYSVLSPQYFVSMPYYYKDLLSVESEALLSLSRSNL